MSQLIVIADLTVQLHREDMQLPRSSPGEDSELDALGWVP